ncbi:MAG: hypothetical protein WCT23_06425 [Candidatus Neomarinimicrobiota bacterium]
MKINLLRDEHLAKPSADKKDKEARNIGEPVIADNDDFYFEQPPVPTGRYKGQRKFSIGWLIFLLILLSVILLLVTNFNSTKNLFSRLANKIKKDPQASSEIVQSRDYSAAQKEYVADIPKTQPKTPAPVVKIEQARPVQEIIHVEKIIHKEVIKTSKEEKILGNPPIYEKIRDDIALSKRNFFASEYAWSKVPGGVTMESIILDNDVLRIVLSSRSSALINSYPNVMSQNDMFTMFVPNEPEIIDEITKVYMYSELPDLDPSDRPEQLWDLKVKSLDDYLKLAATDADLDMTTDVKAPELLENEILVHNVDLKLKGERTAMMVFLNNIQAIPASISVKALKANYDRDLQSYVMDLDLVSYERK